MYENKFSKWIKWIDRNNIKGMKLPGVYVIAHSSKDISGDDFGWISKIIYVGMTNSIKGLKSRLKQFDNTIIGKRGHGGADRVKYKYKDYEQLTPNLYVSAAPFTCDVRSNNPIDLKVMGDVAKFEYYCIAQYVEKFGMLPEFNNKKEAPKYSKTSKDKKKSKKIVTVS